MSVQADVISASKRPVVLLFALVLLAGAAGVTLLFVPKTLVLLGGAAGLAGFAVLWLTAECLIAGKLEPLLVLWALVFPLGYYFLSFPREKTILTLDRCVVILAAASVILRPKAMRTKFPPALSTMGIMWGLFAAAAAASLINVPETTITGPARILVESFVLPALFGWCILTAFQVRTRKYLVFLHRAVCVAMIYCAAIGVMEILQRRDIFPLPGSGMYYAGGQVVGLGGAAILRPNGPFATNHSYALIGLISLLFLFFLRAVLNERFSFPVRVLHYLALLASLAVALMPMYRSVIMTLVLIVLLELFRRKGWTGRLGNVAVLVVCAVGMAQILSVAPEQVKQERTSMANVYGRIAQETQTLEMFAMNPSLGVGLGNYGYAITQHPISASFEGVSAVNAPHNTLFEILSETGLLGFVPFVMAQVLLLHAFLRVRARRTYEAMLVWRTFLYAYLTYWITGLSLGSGYSADLNMWFIFVVALLYKFAMTEMPVRPAMYAQPRSAAGMYQPSYRSQPIVLGNR